MSFKEFHTQRLNDFKLPGVVFAFGRMNPPTKGHQYLIDNINKYARKNNLDSKIYLSWVQNKKKNPLRPQDKIKYVEKMLHKNQVINKNESLNTPYLILKDLVNAGYKRITLMVGADRINDFNSMKKYVTEWSNGEASITIKSPDTKRYGNFSGTRLRALAKDNTPESDNEFYNNLSDKLSLSDKKELLQKVKDNI